MQHDTIRYLITQYVNGELTPAQQEELLQLLGTENETELIDVLKSMLETESQQAVAIDAEAVQPSLQKVLMIDKAAKRNGRVKAMVRYWSWAAAAVLIIIAGAIVVFTTGKKKAAPEVVQAVPANNDVQPGGNKAILTLANGQRIVLDSAANGKLVKQGSAQVVKDGEGLRYEVSGQQSEVAYNILSTPKGGQYRLTLPDGSKVWLNAASSIRYPAAFTGNERSVDITGEAYFEVSTLRLRSGQKKPFKVHFADGVVEVLGTHFNVNTYQDEETVKTTLLEGKVKVKVKSDSLILQPGQQDVFYPYIPVSRVKDVDTEEAVAWTNDMFIFRDQDLASIMRQISRWYDVQVTYDKNVKNEKIVATISRNVPLSKVLHLLEATGMVHFAMNGKKIVVLP